MGAASRLTAGQRQALERDGCLLVPSLLDDTVIQPMRCRLDDLVRQTVDDWDANPGMTVEEGGVVHAQLDLADPLFAHLHAHPLLADAASLVLGPAWHVRQLELRAPIPGCGHQGLHPDFEHRPIGGVPWRTLSAMWCVSEFTRDNGPLRVIPGSHLVDADPCDALAFGSGMGPHPDEIKIIAPAGSLILFNASDLWHSGTLNYSPGSRLAVTACLDPG